jgi:hypothetical protein
MRRSTSRLVASLAVLFSATAASAADNFTAAITSNGTTSNQSSSANLDFTSVTSLINQFKSGQLSATLPTYTQTSIANAVINYRGLAATLSYPTNGTALVFKLPAAGINETFTGRTRDDSQQQLLNFLQKSSLYGKVVNALVASSPTEPLAGNPTSLMAQMVGRDFSSAFNGTDEVGSSDVTPHGGEAGLGLAYSHFTQGGIAVDSMTLPLSYSFRFERDPRYVLTFELPISYTNSGGAKTAAVSFGVGLSIPLSDQWTITPKLSSGATGSIDLGSGGVLVSGSVTSAYRFKAWDNDFILGNMLGIAQSVGISIGSYSFDPHITNEYMKNGLLVSRPLRLMGVQAESVRDVVAQAWVMDTRFAGSKLYDDSFQEVGVSLGKHLATFGNYVRIGATYFHAHHSNGAMVNFGYTF